MSDTDDDRTASLMTPAKLAQLKARPQPAASPAAWLDQLASDAGSGHVRRLVELGQQLEAAVRGREGDFGPLGVACTALHDALGQLDFSLVQPKGWLARATGKGKEAAATFGKQHDRVLRVAEDLADDLKALQKPSSAAGGADRMALEIEAEMRALEKIMDQGARWLQDMRNQLKARQTQGGDAAVQQQIREDSARCELLVARLKLLRDVNTAAQQALERTQAAAARRASVLAALAQWLDEEWKPARQRLEAVARKVEDEGAAAEGIEPARRAVEALQPGLRQAHRDCGAVQATAQAASDALAAMQGPLRAAA